MALGRKQSNGLDISGVGKRQMRLSGGDMKSRRGLQISASGEHVSSSAGHGGRARSRKNGNFVGGGKKGRDGRLPHRTLALIIAVMAAAVLLAVGVGYLVYQQTVRNAVKPDIDEQSLSAVLSSSDSSDDSSWSVIVKTDASSAEAGRGQVQYLALLYVDPSNKTASFLWIPADTRIYLDGYGYRTVGDAFSLLGESGLVSSMAKLGDVSISHYMEINEIGLHRFEENLQPLELSGSKPGRDELVSAICKRVCGSSSEQMSEMGEYFADCFASDMDAKAAATLFGSLQGLDVSADLYQVDAPVESKTEDGNSYSSIDSDSWNSIVARVRTGQSPVASKKELSEYESMRGSSVVDIWNGVGVSGIASDCSSELKKLGWKIGKTGNAAQFVYSETLVVYNDTKDKKLAELVVSDLGQGRVVRGAARYSFTGDVLVVLGSDYRPY